MMQMMAGWQRQRLCGTTPATASAPLTDQLGGECKRNFDGKRPVAPKKAHATQRKTLGQAHGRMKRKKAEAPLRLDFF